VANNPDNLFSAAKNWNPRALAFRDFGIDEEFFELFATTQA
jgi:hypothetical protein